MSTVTLPRSISMPSRETFLWGALLVNTEILLVVGYMLLSDSQVLNLAALRLYVYPFIWINISLWALRRVRPQVTTRRRNSLAIGLAIGYFLILAYLGGLVSFSGSSGLDVTMSALTIPPGWGPTLSVDTAGLLVTLLPYKTIGFVTLSYLVYVTAIEVTGLFPAVLGLFSCISCVWAAVVAPAAGVIGGSTAMAGIVYAGGYDLSTAVFVLAVLLLAWQPTVGDRIPFASGSE